MNKRVSAALLALVLSLTACGVQPLGEAGEDAPAQVPDGEEARHAFGAVLWQALLNGSLPDGGQLDYIDAQSAADNQFALCDVDGDGEEELLLYWTQAAMAGQRLEVFGFGGDGVYSQLTAFPQTTFYDNGVAREDWSHDQGLSGADFWPYFLHVWQEEDDCYRAAGAAVAWSRESGGTQREFPAEADGDGDGTVYFLLPADESWRYEEQVPAYEPLDGPEYEAWREGYLAGAREISIPLQALSEENIAALGCPRPEWEAPEAAG